MKRGTRLAAILVVVLLRVVLIGGLAEIPIQAQDGDVQAMLAALQTQVAALSTRVAQFTTPGPGVAASATGAVTQAPPA